MKVECRGLYLPRLLATCARYAETGDFLNASAAVENIASVASPDGDPMQRVATYLNKGLAFRLVKNFRGVRKALELSNPLPTIVQQHARKLFLEFCPFLNKGRLAKNFRGVPEALELSNPLPTIVQQHARKLFLEFCPFLKFSYLITNQSIVDTMRGEQVFHIIDLNACDATQWIYLLHTLKEQHHGDQLPFLKITGIHEDKEVLEQIGFQLIQEAERLNITIHFYPILSQLEKICFEKLPLKLGEPLAISSVLHLHSLLAVDDQISPDSVLPPNPSQCVSPKMRWFLSSLWKLQPRLMVITEQESDNNGPSLTDRLDKALNFYGTLFNCLEANAPKAKAAERIMLERMLLGEEIKNIIGCDGIDRKERHGKFLKTWRPLLELAGFMRVPMDYERMLQVTRPLQNYGSGYKLLDSNQCLYTCWNDLPLFSISAWRF